MFLHFATANKQRQVHDLIFLIYTLLNRLLYVNFKLNWMDVKNCATNCMYLFDKCQKFLLGFIQFYVLFKFLIILVFAEYI